MVTLGDLRAFACALEGEGLQVDRGVARYGEACELLRTAALAGPAAGDALRGVSAP